MKSELMERGGRRWRRGRRKKERRKKKKKDLMRRLHCAAGGEEADLPGMVEWMFRSDRLVSSQQGRIRRLSTVVWLLVSFGCYGQYTQYDLSFPSTVTYSIVWLNPSFDYNHSRVE